MLLSKRKSISIDDQKPIFKRRKVDVLSVSTPKVFDTISRSQYPPSYISHLPLCKQINRQSITNVFEIQPKNCNNCFHQSGLELNIAPGSPLVLLLVGKLGDSHVWAAQSIVNSRRAMESHQLCTVLPFSSSNTDMRDSIFSNASFAVVRYIYNISNTAPPNNPYDFPLLLDTTCSLLKALGALDPLGGGRYPLDALVVVDGGGSVRVLMPISTWGLEMCRRTVCKANQHYYNMESALQIS